MNTPAPATMPHDKGSMDEVGVEINSKKKINGGTVINEPSNILKILLSSFPAHTLWPRAGAIHDS